MIIKETLRETTQKLVRAIFIDQPALEAEVLLSYVTEKSREWLWANLNQPLEKDSKRKLAKLIARRLTGEPIAYLIGQKEFYGLEFIVTKDVLIPRPETELLVQESLKFLRDRKPARVVDIGTGSGAIAISIAKNRPLADIWASDISPKALRVAQRNSQKHQVKIKFIKSDLFNHISGRFDLIVANLPYLAPREATTVANLFFQPRVSLAGGLLGLKIIKSLLKECGKHLNRKGAVIIEIAPKQKGQLIKFIGEIFPQATTKTEKDLSGRDRAVIVYSP
jgi:release factor glutamine methyltransferase